MISPPAEKGCHQVAPVTDGDYVRFGLIVKDDLRLGRFCPIFGREMKRGRFLSRGTDIVHDGLEQGSTVAELYVGFILGQKPVLPPELISEIEGEVDDPRLRLSGLFIIPEYYLLFALCIEVHPDIISVYLATMYRYTSLCIVIIVKIMLKFIVYFDTVIY